MQPQHSQLQSFEPTPPRRGGFGGFAESVPPIGGMTAPGMAPAPALIDPLTGKTVEPPKQKVYKPKKEKRSDMSILDRIKVSAIQTYLQYNQFSEKTGIIYGICET